jgi:FKBP-type peptidyl-prolyl cis-trans isomerase SlyD
MVVTKDKVVSLTYELRVNKPDGDIIESLSPDAPLIFMYGNDGLLPKFEQNIDGLAVGESFDFNLKANEAYGEVNDDAIVNVPKNVFEVNGVVDESLLQLDKTIPMQDTSGRKLSGVVKAINGDSVTMDFNHPLAGQDLFFKGKITELRDATAEELEHGHAHYPGSCEGCEHCGGEGDKCC